MQFYIHLIHCFNLKWIAKRAPNHLCSDQFNNIEMHVLSFGSQIEMFLCFILGKRLVNCPHASKSAEKHGSDSAEENK